MLSNDTVREGDSVTLTCEAIGYPPPTVVWSRPNGVLSNRVLVSDSISVPTGNGNVTSVSVYLTVASILIEDGGDYKCFASNNIGNDSAIVTLESK